MRLRHRSLAVVAWSALAVLSVSANAYNVDTAASATKEQDKIGKIAARFKGSSLLLDQSITPETFPGVQLSRVPSYQWWISMRPRFYITSKLSLRMRFDLTIEWLNAGADTTRVRELQVGDFHTGLGYELPPFGGIKTTVGANAVWGTSKDAIAATSVVKLGPTLGFSRTFETKKAGTFGLGLNLSGSYNIVRYTSPGTLTAYDCTSLDFTSQACIASDGPMNTQGSLLAGVSATYSPPKAKALTFSVGYTVIDSWAYPVPDATLTNAAGETTVVAHDVHDTRFRQKGWFIASIDYDALDWFSLSLGYYCFGSMVSSDGNYNPFYKPGGATRIFLTGSFALDSLGETIARKVQKSKKTARFASPIRPF